MRINTTKRVHWWRLHLDSGRHGTLLSRLGNWPCVKRDSPPERAFTLGGFGRLSGYSPNELAGSELTLLSLVGYQPIESNLGLGQLYRGFSVEAGNVFLEDADDNFDNLLTGVSFFMGLESRWDRYIYHLARRKADAEAFH